MVSQTEFVDQLEKPRLRSRVPGTDLVNDQEVKSLRSVLGGALWLAKETRPDLAVQVSMGQQLFPRPTLEKARTVAHVVKRAKQYKDLTWHIKAVPLEDLRLCLHTDAAFANAKREGTQAGYIVGDRPQTGRWKDSSVDSSSLAIIPTQESRGANVCRGDASVSRWSGAYRVVGMSSWGID